jgi:hypothetical protein
VSDFWDSFWEGPLGLVAFVVVTLVVVVGGLGIGIRQISHHYDVANCGRFGEESGREVRFVDYTFWSWDCLTPTQDGKWISIDRLRDID